MVLVVVVGDEGGKCGLFSRQTLHSLFWEGKGEGCKVQIWKEKGIGGDGQLVVSDRWLT